MNRISFVRVQGGFDTVKGSVKRIEGSVKCIEDSVKRIEGSVKRIEGSVKCIEDSVKRIEGSVKCIEDSVKRIEDSVNHIEHLSSVYQVLSTISKVMSGISEGSAKRIEGHVEHIKVFRHSRERNPVHPLIRRILVKTTPLFRKIHRSMEFSFIEMARTLFERGEMKHEELTYKIIGCAMAVHAALGNGFPEVIYQRSPAIEMQDQGLTFEREREMPLYYKGHHVGKRRADFFVEEKILLELKAVIQLEDAQLAQAINYVKAYNREVGLLINFGNRSLQYKRVFLH